MSGATLSRVSSTKTHQSYTDQSCMRAPALPSHITAIGTHQSFTRGSGHYWIGPAHSEPLNDNGLVLQGIVLYNTTTCLFLEQGETEEAIELAQQVLQLLCADARPTQKGCKAIVVSQ